MKKRGVMLSAVAGLALLVFAMPSATKVNAGEPENAPCAGMALAGVEDPVASEVDIAPVPGGCLSNQPISCAGMLIPVGGTCSCSSTLLDVRCRSCETGNRGQVLQTTCTVRKPCNSFPCDLELNHSRTGYSCTG